MAINDYFHVTDAGAGDKSGDSWANAMDEAAFESHLEGAVVAGDVHFVMDGSYTLDSDIDFNARDGTEVSPIVIIGVKSGTTNEGAAVVYSDWSRDAADRPFFDCATYRIHTGNFCIVRNFDLQGADYRVLQVDNDCLIENCRADNDYGSSAERYAYDVAVTSRLINCEGLSANCNILLAWSNSKILFNYFHDSSDATYGIGVDDRAYDDNILIAFNIFDNLTIGIKSVARQDTTVLNNTFYECDKGVSNTTGYSWTCINNIMEENDTDGFVWTTQTDSNFFWKNHGDDARCNDMWDLVDTTTVFQDYEVSTGDPKFTTPGSDFSLQDSSPNIDNGIGISLGV